VMSYSSEKAMVAWRRTYMSIWKKAPVHMSDAELNRPKFMSAVEIW
jgi:hypothetical protein